MGSAAVQALIEPVHGPPLALEPMPEPAAAEPTEYRGALGQQCEVAWVIGMMAGPS
jgi:hypothetical protein